MSDASEWANVVVTGLGSTGTVAAFIVTYRLLRHQVSDRRAFEQRHRQRQATEVECWYDTWQVSRDEEPYRCVYGARILNGSPLPVYDVHLRWARQRTAQEELEERWRSMLLAPVHLDVLPPGPPPQFVAFYDCNQVADSNLRDGIVTMAVQMSFRDSAGVRWVRRFDGTLAEETRNAALRAPQGWELIPVADVSDPDAM